MARPGRMLAIFAHPDDETLSAGTFAAFTDQGGQVTLISATRGEVGEISDPSLATPETLGAVREGELRDSMSKVGVSDVRFLNYRDSGMAGTAENDDPRAFMQADDAEVVDRLLTVMREVDPDIVVTFGEDGVYGHPDHLKIHRDATAAVRAFAAESGDSGPTLYYNAIPRERFQAMAERNPDAFSWMTPEELANLGSPSESITTVIDVSDQYDRKRASLFAHATQISPNGPWREMTPEIMREVLSLEHFRKVEGAGHEAASDPLFEALGSRDSSGRKAGQ